MRVPVSSRLLIGLCCSCAFLASICEVQAQVGNNNPTGVSGMFNGNVTTGCSYDPYTGNATRRVTDITITGAVGKYGLALTRTSNSRRESGFWFGTPGSWKHQYEWELDDSLETTSQVSPSLYQMAFPDGRYENFYCSPSQTYCGAGTGVAERFQRLDTSTLRAYLILADGGKVEFGATLNSEWDPDTRQWWYW